MSETYDGVTVTEEELNDGYSAETIFCSPGTRSFTFDDMITMPGQIDFGVEQVELLTRLTRNITLAYPFASSPMDTVTESKMATAMALQGAIGILHHNCSVEEQVAMVDKVKKYENGFIEGPAVLSPDSLVSDLDRLKSAKAISGVPITENGQLGSKLVGLCTKRDTDLVVDRNAPLSKVMTPVGKLVVGRLGISLDDAQKLLKECKKGYLPIVDDAGKLRQLTTRTDLLKSRDYPHSTKDKDGKLRVGAAVGALEADRERVDALVKAGVDVLVIDERNGDSRAQIEQVKYIKQKHSHVDVVAGNVVTVHQARNLLTAGADAIRVGMGAGSVSTLQQTRAVGRAQISAVYHVSKLCKQHNVPVIADGGIMNTGCAIKALTLGASVVMMGSLLAGTEEAPGDYFYQEGMRLKHYQGVSSLHAMQRRLPDAMAGYNGVASGVSGVVVDRGSLHRFIPYMVQSVRHGFQDMGCVSLQLAHDWVYAGKIRFEVRSTSAQKEGGIHDLHSYSRKLFA